MLYTIKFPSGFLIERREGEVAPALIAEYELKTTVKAARGPARTYPLRSKTTMASLGRPSWMNKIIMLLTMVQIVSTIDRYIWKGPDLGKAYDCSYIMGEVVMNPPGSDFCEHMQHATKVMMAKYSGSSKNKEGYHFSFALHKSALWFAIPSR